MYRTIVTLDAFVREMHRRRCHRVHQNGAALMEQNASKPLTPEPRLSQVSPFVSSPTPPASVYVPVKAGSTIHLPISGALTGASQIVSKVVITGV